MSIGAERFELREQSCQWPDIHRASMAVARKLLRFGSHDQTTTNECQIIGTTNVTGSEQSTWIYVSRNRKADV